MYEVNTLAVVATERMLDYGGEMLASVKRLNAGRDAFVAAMQQLNLRTFRSEGNFLHVAFGQPHPMYIARLKVSFCTEGFQRAVPQWLQPLHAHDGRTIRAGDSAH